MFRADYSFLVPRGNDQALLAMIMATIKPGDKIIVPRNIQKSVITAILLSGANPIFVQPMVDRNLGISHVVTTSAITKAISTHPNVAAIVVSHPTYYGITNDLREIIRVAHAQSIPVLVDETLGGHFSYSELLPISAVQAGADISVTKTSQPDQSIFHLKKGLINIDKVKSVLNMLFPLVIAGNVPSLFRSDEMEHMIQLADYTRQKVNEIPGIYCFGHEINNQLFNPIDRIKLTIHMRNQSLPVSDVIAWIGEYHVEVEMSDPSNVLFTLSPSHTIETSQALVKAFSSLVKKGCCHHHRNPYSHLPDTPILAIPSRMAFYAETEQIPLDEANGRISADFITVYPTGVSIFIPGEIITRTNIDYSRTLKEAGVLLQGLDHDAFLNIKVVKFSSAI